jgi:large subunit ribosomal protein L20
MLITTAATVNAICAGSSRMNGTTYSRLIAGMRRNNVIINRKMLADIAVHDPKAFVKVVETALA